MMNDQMPGPTEEDVREGWIISLGDYPDSTWLEEKYEFEHLRDSQPIRSHFILSGSTWAVLDDELLARDVGVALAKVWDAYVAEGILAREDLDHLLDTIGHWRVFGRDPARPRRVRCYFGETDPSIPSDLVTPDKDVVVKFMD
jgi:hypothetical protein